MMNSFFNVESFISTHITGRPVSLFKEDLDNNANILRTEIEDKNVMVIGGAGTIGSSFIKAMLPFHPGKLVVVDINENGLTELVRDCRSSNETPLPEDFKSYPIDFGSDVFTKVLVTHGPFDIVANFAAHKHVRSEKDSFSIEAMLENNLYKAKRLLNQLLAVVPPKHFFCVSTDKAANPVNVMGASKKLMEDLVLSYAKHLKISSARFANVAFSNGSLLAGYIERMMKQQPLSCPSDVKRYFVSPKESGQLCLLACILGKTGEIFFPKLSIEKDLVSFKEITVKFLDQLGLSPVECNSEQEARTFRITEREYPVCFFESNTSGEKLYEEFYTEDEQINLSAFKSLGIISNSASHSKEWVSEKIDQLKNLMNNEASKADIVKYLRTLIPNFQHIETTLNLDQKM
jgi:FlaA1/EpsC-like NDP-sugar epimerase